MANEGAILLPAELGTFRMPLLIDCLNQCTTYEAAFWVLKTYFAIKDHYVEHLDSQRELSQPCENATEIWKRGHDKLFDACIENNCRHLGSINSIWCEINDSEVFLRTRQSYNKALSYSDNYTKPINVYMLDQICLQATVPWVESIVERFIVQQPTYLIHPDPILDHPNPEPAQVDEIPALSRLLQSYGLDRESVQNVFQIFGGLVSYSCMLTYEAQYIRDDREETLGEKVKKLERVYESIVCDPFSSFSLSFRRELSIVDFVSIAICFAHDGNLLVMQHPLEQLFLRAHKRMVDYMISALESTQGLSMLQDALQDPHCQSLLHPGPQDSSPVSESVAMYIPGLDIVSDSENDDSENEDSENEDSENEELIPLELCDVGFRPSGLPLNISDYAQAARAPPGSSCRICIGPLRLFSVGGDQLDPMRIACGHTFHLECLQTLINGISEFSNLCPICRHPICERRAREPIL